MESKYKERANYLYNELAKKEQANHLSQYAVVDTMCQLAEEVEQVYKDPLVFGETGSIQKVYSKAYVEELLQQQRELCAKKAKIRLSVDGLETIEKEFYPQYSDEHYSIDENSIKNAKLKID